MFNKIILTIAAITIFTAVPSLAATGCNKIKFFGSYTSPQLNDDVFGDDVAARLQEHHEQIERAAAKRDRPAIGKKLACARHRAEPSKPNDAIFFRAMRPLVLRHSCTQAIGLHRA